MSRFLRTKTHDDAHVVVDLEHIITYRQATYYGEEKKKHKAVVVYTESSNILLFVSFEDFDRAFMAYQASKVFPGYPWVPPPPVEPLTPTEPYEPKDRYAPTTTTGELIWKGTSDTTTTVRLTKVPKVKKGKKK